MMKKIFLILFALALISGFASVVYAATPGTNATLEFVEGFTSGITGQLLSFARKLFIGLATLSLAMGLGKMILSGESNIGSVAAHIAKCSIYIGIFSWIMSDSGATTFLPKLIVNSFMEAGRSIAGQDVAPYDLLVAGIRLYGTMVERGWNAGWGDFIGIMLIGIVILVVVAMLAGTMAVALIEMHLVICGGAILIGFGGFEYSRDIALSYLRYSVSIGVKLLMIMIVYALANALLIDWEATFVAATDMATLITTAGQILGGTICIFMASKMVPSMAQSVVSGAALSFGHELFNSTASSVAHGIIGEKSPGGGRSGGLFGAGKTIVESLRNAQTSTFRGVADTWDAAKDGGFSGTVEHVASHIPVVNNLMDAHRTGNMLHYVAASTLFGSQSDRATRYLANDNPEMSPATQITSPNGNAHELISHGKEES